jgi:hypothetical protein
MSWTIDIPQPQTASQQELPRYHAPQSAGDPQELGGLAEMSEFYRQVGFDAGYGQAARDQLELSVTIAEQILQERGDLLRGATDARRLLYSFIALIDRRLGQLVSPSPVTSAQDQAGIVEGGLGI